MTLRESITSQLDTDVTTVSSRIYPVAPVDAPTLPALTYSMVETFEYGVDGEESMKSELEITSIAESIDETAVTAAEVHASLHQFQGVLGGAGGVRVLHCLAVQREDQLVEIAPDVIKFAIVSVFDLLYEE